MYSLTKAWQLLKIPFTSSQRNNDPTLTENMEVWYYKNPSEPQFNGYPQTRREMRTNLLIKSPNKPRLETLPFTQLRIDNEEHSLVRNCELKISRLNNSAKVGIVEAWIIDPQIRRGMLMTEEVHLLEELPSMLLNDVLCKCQAFTENMDHYQDMETKSLMVQSLYQFFQERMNDYHNYLELPEDKDDQLSLLIEGYVIAQIHHRLQHEDLNERHRFRQSMNRACKLYEQSDINTILKDQQYLDMVSLNLRTIGSDKFPKWKWWSLNQWGKNLIRYIYSNFTRSSTRDGNILLIASVCLIKAKISDIFNDLLYMQMFSNPFRFKNSDSIYFWNVLRCSIELIHILATYEKVIAPLKLECILNLAYTLEIKKNEKVFLTEEIVEEFRKTLNIQLQCPKGWRRFIRKKLRHNC